MDLGALRDLAAEWRSEAEVCRRWGAESAAQAAERAAADVERRVREWALEELPLRDAAAEAGLSYDALRKRIERGDVPNAGEKGRPRIRRADLYGKPTPRLESGEPDIAAEVLRGLS